MKSESQPTRRTDQKRAEILKTALNIFSREGFRNTDVQVIADLARVGKGTVYRHFGNKEQLFLATAKYCVERLGEFVEQQVGDESLVPAFIAEHGTPELLRRIARACAEFYQQHPQTVEIMIQERAEFRDSVFPTHLMFRAETRGGFDELLRMAMAQGELRTVDVKEASNAIGDLIFGSVVNGCLEGGKGRLVERVDHAVGLLLDGLVIPKGAQAAGDSQ